MESKNYPLIFRQGDVILVQQFHAAVNDKAYIKSDSKTLAYGEITGHHHSFRDSDQVLVFKNPQNMEPEIVQVEQGQTAVLEHQEHLPLEIPEGVYHRIIQTEYNPFLERQVRTVD